MKGKYQCIRHKYYYSKEVAEQAIPHINKIFNINVKRSYKCNWCAGWHLTSK